MVYDGRLAIRMFWFWHAAIWLPITLYEFWVKMKIKVYKSDNCCCITKSNAFMHQCVQVYRHYKVLQNEWLLKFSTHKIRSPIQWWYAMFRSSIKRMQGHNNRVIAAMAERHRNFHFSCDDWCYSLHYEFLILLTAQQRKSGDYEIWLSVMGLKVYFLWVIILRGPGSFVKIAEEDLVVPSPKLNTWVKLGISFCSLQGAELTKICSCDSIVWLYCI